MSQGNCIGRFTAGEMPRSFVGSRSLRVRLRFLRMTAQIQAGGSLKRGFGLSAAARGWKSLLRLFRGFVSPIPSRSLAPTARCVCAGLQNLLSKLRKGREIWNGAAAGINRGQTGTFPFLGPLRERPQRLKPVSFFGASLWNG